MSVKVSALIWKMPLLLPEKLVLLRMADYADHDGGSIFPSVATVARDCGISDRAVQLVLRKFVADGLLVIVGNATGGRGKTRHYAIDLERAADLAGPGGEPKRAKRAKGDFTHSGAVNGHDESAERVKRVQNSAVKGEEILHPTCHRSVSKESGAVCVTLDQPPAQAPACETTHTAAAPRSAEIIPLVQPGGERLAMVANWVPRDDWRRWGVAAGHGDIDAGCAAFRDEWLKRQIQGVAGPPKTEREWWVQFAGWIMGDIQRGRYNGRKSNNGYGQQDNGLTALAKSGYFSGIDDAESDPDDGRRRFV